MLKIHAISAVILPALLLGQNFLRIRAIIRLGDLRLD
jgi:hypothetical protein